MRLYLLELRHQKGYSMRKLARETNMSYQHYVRLETGRIGERVGLITMGRIAKALGVSLDTIYPLEEEYVESLIKDKELKEVNNSGKEE